MHSQWCRHEESKNKPTYICFWSRQAKLNETYLGFLHSAYTSAGHFLGQDQPFNQFTVIYCSPKIKHSISKLTHTPTVYISKLVFSEVITYPSFLTILMSLRSTLLAVAVSITFITASTLIGERRLEYCETT